MSYWSQQAKQEPVDYSVLIEAHKEWLAGEGIEEVEEGECA